MICLFGGWWRVLVGARVLIVLSRPIRVFLHFCTKCYFGLALAFSASHRFALNQLVHRLDRVFALARACISVFFFFFIYDVIHAFLNRPMAWRVKRPVLKLVYYAIKRYRIK